MSESMNKIVISPKEAMQILGVGRNCMYEKLLKDKTFPAFTIDGGKKIFINKAKLQSWIDSKCR